MTTVLVVSIRLRATSKAACTEVEAETGAEERSFRSAHGVLRNMGKPFAACLNLGCATAMLKHEGHGDGRWRERPWCLTAAGLAVVYRVAAMWHLSAGADNDY